MALSSYKTLPAAWKSETKEEKRSKRHQTQSIGTETESAARFGSMHLEDKIEWPFKSESLFASLARLTGIPLSSRGISIQMERMEDHTHESNRTSDCMHIDKS